MVAAHLGRDLLLRAVRQPAPAPPLVLRLEHLCDVVDLVLRLDLGRARRLPVELLGPGTGIELAEREDDEHHQHEAHDHDQGEGVDPGSVVCPRHAYLRPSRLRRARRRRARRRRRRARSRATRWRPSQTIPHKFLENILADLRHARLVRSPARAPTAATGSPSPAEDISLADVIRAVEGPLASVRGEAPEDVEYPGAAEHLQDIWIAVRASVRSVVENVTLADLAAGELPPEIKRARGRPGGVGQALTCPAGGRSHTIEPASGSSASASARVSCAETSSPSRAHELHAHLEAEVHDALDHRLLPAVLRRGRRARRRAGARARRRRSRPGRGSPSRTSSAGWS